MQVFVKFPDLGLPAVSVTAGAGSVVSEVLTIAAEEWDVDPEGFELSFAGDTLCENERLADRGVGADSELEMWEKRFRLFGKCWFVDDTKRKKLLRWVENHGEEYLYLDTPAFIEDGCLIVDTRLMPVDAQRISFRNSNSTDITAAASQVFTVGDEFLNPCLQITSLDLSGLSGVVAIGNYFLSDLSLMTSLNLSGLSSVTTIGSKFLYYCGKITSLDLSALSSVTTIGNDFLSHCSDITSLDLSGLASVIIIGNHFLCFCTKITSLDLSSLTNVTSIGHCFLNYCVRISAIDLSGLSSVRKIGYKFIRNCDALESVQLPVNNDLLEKSMKPLNH